MFWEVRPSVFALPTLQRLLWRPGAFYPKPLRAICLKLSCFRPGVCSLLASSCSCGMLGLLWDLSGLRASLPPVALMLSDISCIFLRVLVASFSETFEERLPPSSGRSTAKEACLSA